MKTHRDVTGWFDQNSEKFFSDVVYKIIQSKTPPYVFIELGTYMGRSCIFLLSILKNWNKLQESTIICVDTWSYWNPEHRKQFKEESTFDIFKKNIFECGFSLNDIYPIISNTKNASMLIRDNFADFIYIDAGHDYAAVKCDIECWKPKLKKDGILCGDDYSPDLPGVIRAVDEVLPDKKTTGRLWYV